MPLPVFPDLTTTKGAGGSRVQAWPGEDGGDGVATHLPPPLLRGPEVLCQPPRARVCAATGRPRELTDCSRGRVARLVGRAIQAHLTEVPPPPPGNPSVIKNAHVDFQNRPGFSDSSCFV